MKSCKRWTTTGAATCALCRNVFPESTAGVLCDLAGPIDQTTIVKFVCTACAGPIATAMVGPELVQRSAQQHAAAESQMRQMLRGRGDR